MGTTHPGTLTVGPLSKKRGDHVIEFIEALTLSTDSVGAPAGAPFLLRPWQKRIVRELFGRMRADDTKRRAYRTGFIALPRKQGKTELCAALALYGLIGDSVNGGQVYSAAAEREQAAQVFNAAQKMVEHDPELAARIDILTTRKRMIDKVSGSFYQALSAEAFSKHGFNASLVIYDELHAAPNRELWDVLRTSQGARREPMMIAITTAGYDKTTICWEQWDYARKVRDGVIADPAFFQVLYEAPDGADWTDETVWRAANPALGDFRDIDEMRALAREARYKPELQNTFRRLYLNQWTEQEVAWLDMHKWRACAPADVAEAAGLPTYCGLDLGLKSDLSAMVGATPLPDGRVLVRCQFWMPGAAKERYRSRPYDSWQRAGHLTVTSGDVTDFGRLRRDVERLCEEWNVVELAYDERFAAAVIQEMAVPHVVLIDQPQGFALNIGLRALEDLAVSGALCHNGEPVLQWMASNAVIEEGRRGDIAVNKRNARDKIDGIVALAMALQRLRLRTQKKKSRYADGGKVEAVAW